MNTTINGSVKALPGFSSIIMRQSLQSLFVDYWPYVKRGSEIPDVGEDYTLQQPEDIRGRVAFGALPWLMHDQPFVQGLTACAEIGEAMARAVVKPASRARRRLSFD